MFWSLRGERVLGRATDDWLNGRFGDDTIEGAGGNDTILGGTGDDVLRGDRDEDTLGHNLVQNGSFEDVSGLRARDFGFVGTPTGWTLENGVAVEVVRDGWVGMPASDGGYWVDTGTVGSDVIDISQQIDGVEAGETYLLTFDAGQWRAPSDAPDETLNVYWNGELLGTIRPDSVDAYETFQFNVEGGSGDGTGTLRFAGQSDGTADAQGVVIDNVSLQEVLAVHGNDVLFGGWGDDTIFGDGGNDRIIGGFGDDVTTGGEGHDTFVIGVRHGHDIITDFDLDEDVIALRFLRFMLDDGETARDAVDITQVGDDAQIAYGHATVLLLGVNANLLTDDHFI